MAGTRTAPTVDGTSFIQKRLAMSFRGADGDAKTVSGLIPDGATPAQIEAVVAAIAAGSTASLYSVEITDVYIGADSVQNADGSGGRTSVQDLIRFSMKNLPQGFSKRYYVPAPVSDFFLANSETIDTIDVVFTDITSALDALEPAEVTFSTVGFVEHQETNKAQKL